jgi:hypothetical protein
LAIFTIYKRGWQTVVILNRGVKMFAIVKRGWQTIVILNRHLAMHRASPV